VLRRRCYAGALHLDANDARASANLAAVFLKQKNWMQAFSYAAAAMRLEPDAPTIGKWHYRCARALHGLRRYDRAVQIYDRALACADARADPRLQSDVLASKKVSAAAAARAAARSDHHAAEVEAETRRVERFFEAYQDVAARPDPTAPMPPPVFAPSADDLEALHLQE